MVYYIVLCYIRLYHIIHKTVGGTGCETGLRHLSRTAATLLAPRSLLSLVFVIVIIIIIIM